MSKKCKSCGGALEEAGLGKYKCPWCGSEWSIEDMSNGAGQTDLEVFSLLTKARTAIELEYDFKESLKYSQSVLEKNPASQEANWLALLAENQIAYIQNEEGKYTPTFLAPEGRSLKQSNYYKALNEHYLNDADAIEQLRLTTLEEFKKIKPYDVFISYKQHETGSDKETKEAVWARDIYTELKTNPRTRHLNVFFDQKCLTGSNVGWEPHIYAAIRASKCMVLLGSSLENINSRWVKNEWKRFLSYKGRGEKKEIIVLGSDSVNPLLLDAPLQEKQMITNTSGKWLDEICGRVADVCGKPAKQKEEEPEVKKPPKKKKKPVNKKAIIATIVAFFILLAGAGIGGGIYYANGMKDVKQTISLIEYIPASGITDFSQYEEIIDEAYGKYDSLKEWQKKKVDNRDILLNILDEYNVYKVEKLRAAADEITPETVGETDALQRTVTIYRALTSDQKALLSSDEIYKFDNLAKVYDVVTAIDDINQDILEKYSKVEEVKRNYLAIADSYKNLVYNYGLIETFDAMYATYSRFEFVENPSGYSVTLKEGQTLSGEVTVPSEYKGKKITEISENAFANSSALTAINIPDTVKTIGAGALKGCNKLNSITLPFVGKTEEAETYESVLGWIFGYVEKDWYYTGGGYYSQFGFVNYDNKMTEANAIWQGTWKNATSYSGLAYFYYIPTSLRTVTVTKQTAIPEAAFNGCSWLTSITYESEVKSVGNYAFQNCSDLVGYNSEVVGTADFGAALSIGKYAVAGCTSLTAILMQDTVKTIGDCAFRRTSITSIVVPDSVTTMGDGVFRDCKKLADITLPFVGKTENAETYEAVFGWIFGCVEKSWYYTGGGYYSQFGFINYDNGMVEENAIWQGTWKNASSYSGLAYFYYIPTSLRNVTITKQTVVPVAAFNGCSMLEKVTYKNHIESKGDYAFQKCVQPTEESV